MSTHTFKFHRMSSRSHELMDSIDRVFQAFAIAKKRQVTDDKLRRSSLRHSCRMQCHHRRGGGEGRRVSVHRHRQAVAHQDAVDIRVCDSSGTRVVIAGDHRDLATLVFHLLKILDVHGSISSALLDPPFASQGNRLGNACSIKPHIYEGQSSMESLNSAGIVGGRGLTVGTPTDIPEYLMED